jgi:1,4-dihydroxy-6-naphthoate synthase
MIETKTYTLAYSPCPNDTYVFAALANRLLEQDACMVRVHLADIETLNEAATSGTYELTKVSYGAIPYLMNEYRILRAGGALGRGCGPLVVAQPGRFADFAALGGRSIAIPGERTTANLLLRLAAHELGLERTVPVAMRFDAVMPAVLSGEVDAGLIIHESRFTYPDHGLSELLDLGDWWERLCGLPIPLGAILVRNDIGEEAARDLNTQIKLSLSFARNHERSVMPYVRAHALEMSERVMRAHIALYVNEFSDDVGDEGTAAIRELFARAVAAGVLSHIVEPRFAAA